MKATTDPIIVNHKAIFRTRLPRLGQLLFLESSFKLALMLCGVMTIGLLLISLYSLISESLPSISQFGLSFLTSTSWDPVFGEFGALPFITGTLLTTLLALLISTPISLSIAIFLNFYVTNKRLLTIIKSGVELLAGVPSVIFGFWGLSVLVPLVRNVELFMGAPPYGVGILTASIILAIMIIPYSTTVAYDIMGMIPSTLKEASYAMGATKFETIIYIVIPWSWSGIMSGILLALGRALGETMAVTMVIGNSNVIPDSIFSTGNTIASVIANEFSEATEDLYLSSLVQLGLVLFFITTLFSVLGQKLVKRWSFKK
ncbi:phosphate ABC transporter permease subunit PstC [bacterium]|jgi:phosphate transport system permease protein|nr:phosphate ABC transporter permease subunit PstC [bacterium]